MSEEKTIIRVLEVRKARNGYVLSGFERDYDYHGRDDNYGPYFTAVAATIADVERIVGEILKNDEWGESLHIPPARGYKRC